MKALILLILSCLSLLAQTLKQNHIELGFPLKVGKYDQLIIRVVYDNLLYIVGYDTTLNVPRWVSWNLSPDWYVDAERFD